MLYQKITNIILSLLLLVSTTGLTIDKHYYGESLISISVMHKAESCCEGPCKCCHNESTQIKVKEYFLSSEISKNNYIFSIVINLFEQISFTDIYNNQFTQKFITYKLPLLLCDIPILFQSFLC